MIAHMNPRQFKKLCAKCHSVVLRIDPKQESSTYIPKNGDDHDGWFRRVLKGTKGFGGMSGYYEPEWSDCSAWETLRELVFWHFAEYSNVFDIAEIYPSYPSNLEPNSWQDVLALGERMALECKKGTA